jgi:ornithine cyclodeaminase/alanine dehydrogenase-like protein (mu-crystallin family)
MSLHLDDAAVRTLLRLDPLITLIPGNPERGLPTLLATILLMDPKTGRTLAVMDGTWITALRTAAVSSRAASTMHCEWSAPGRATMK